MSGDSSDSGDLSLSCSVSSVEIEELEVLEVECYLGTVEPYQFELVASDSSAVALPLALKLSPAPVHLGSLTASQLPHVSPLLASQLPTVPLPASQPPVPPSAL